MSHWAEKRQRVIEEILVGLNNIWFHVIDKRNKFQVHAHLSVHKQETVYSEKNPGWDLQKKNTLLLQAGTKFNFVYDKKHMLCNECLNSLTNNTGPA